MPRSRTAMREPAYFVLVALLDAPLHGYAIIKRAEEMSGGRVRLATGTLYTALDRLTDEGLVQLVSGEIISGRIRRTYGLTGAGSANDRLRSAVPAGTRRGNPRHRSTLAGSDRRPQEVT